jgi:acetolactate synthase I/II/III large subunit
MTSSTTREMTGGRAVAEMVALTRPGPIFGMGGFQLLPFYHGVRELGLTHVLVNDERSGAFAANAYAVLSGRPGLCDATLGPGATNLVTGLTESLNAGIPIVAVVGEQDRLHAGKHMTQEAKQAAMLEPASKAYLRGERIERVPEFIRRAFAIATSGRPGPAIVAVPEDIAHASYAFPADDFWIDERYTRVPALRSRPAAADLGTAAGLLGGAQRPVIVAGGGVHLSGAGPELAALAQRLDAPVAHTLTGKGAVACTDPRSIGLLGRFSRFANDVLAAADVILVVGSKLGEIATKRYSVLPPDVPVIHLDVAPEDFGRTARVTVPLWGDVKETLGELAALLPAGPPDRAALWDRVAVLRRAWTAEAAVAYRSGERPIAMSRLIGELRQVLPDDGVLIADGGFASHWSGLLFDTTRPGRSFVTDRGFASIGYGLPAAIGARFARPQAPVVAITGDAGFNMSLGELETARRRGLAFVLVVVNNAASGYVKALQHAMYGAGGYESSDLLELDYAGIARAYGCRGIRVEDPDAIKSALAEALAETGVPVVLDVIVTRDPARMLPAVDSRILAVTPGDRPV